MQQEHSGALITAMAQIAKSLGELTVANQKLDRMIETLDNILAKSDKKEENDAPSDETYSYAKKKR